MSQEPFVWSRKDQDLFQGVMDLHNERYGASAPGVHISLEDGNLDDESLQFCIREAEVGENFIGVALMKMMLMMPQQLRLKWFEWGSLAFEDARHDGRIVETRP